MDVGERHELRIWLLQHIQRRTRPAQVRYRSFQNTVPSLRTAADCRCGPRRATPYYSERGCTRAANRACRARAAREKHSSSISATVSARCSATRVAATSRARNLAGIAPRSRRCREETAVAILGEHPVSAIPVGQRGTTAHSKGLRAAVELTLRELVERHPANALASPPACGWLTCIAEGAPSSVDR